MNIKINKKYQISDDDNFEIFQSEKIIIFKDNDNILYEFIDEIEIRKIYNKYILGIQETEEEKIIDIIVPTRNEELIYKEELIDFKDLEMLDLDIENWEKLEFIEIPINEETKTKEQILEEEIESLKSKLLEQGRKNEKTQMEMLELIMSMM